MRTVILSSLLALFAGCHGSPVSIDCNRTSTTCVCTDGYAPLESTCADLELPSCSVQCTGHGGEAGIEPDLGPPGCTSSADCDDGFVCASVPDCAVARCVQPCDADGGTSCAEGTCSQVSLVGATGGDATASVCVHDGC